MVQFLALSFFFYCLLTLSQNDYDNNDILNNRKRRKGCRNMVTEKAKRTWIIIRTIEAMLLIGIGILTIAKFNTTEFQQYIILILGIFLAIDGVIRVVKFYIEPVTAEAIGEGLISSVFELSFGILLCVERTQVVDLLDVLLVYFTAILCFSAALIFAIGSTVGIINHSRKMWVAVVEYVFAALLITAGVLIFVYIDNAKEVIREIVMVLCGLLLISLGVYSLVTAFVPFGQKAKKVKPVDVEPYESNVVDASFKTKEPKQEEVQKTEDNSKPEAYNSNQIEHQHEVDAKKDDSQEEPQDKPQEDKQDFGEKKN